MVNHLKMWSNQADFETDDDLYKTDFCPSFQAACRVVRFVGPWWVQDLSLDMSGS